MQFGFEVLFCLDVLLLIELVRRDIAVLNLVSLTRRLASVVIVISRIASDPTVPNHLLRIVLNEHLVIFIEGNTVVQYFEVSLQNYFLKLDLVLLNQIEYFLGPFALHCIEVIRANIHLDSESLPVPFNLHKVPELVTVVYKFEYVKDFAA
jgi:hypothetical protein